MAGLAHSLFTLEPVEREAPPPSDIQQPRILRQVPSGLATIEHSGAVGAQIDILYEQSTSQQGKAGYNGLLDVVQPTSHRILETAWIAKHPEVMERYTGEWIVIEGEEIITHNSSYEAARREANRHGIQIPFIFKVPKDLDDAFMGL
jgi:hypothetical protein